MNYINFSIVFVFILVARIHSQSGDNYLIPVNGSFADVIAQTNDDEDYGSGLPADHRNHTVTGFPELVADPILSSPPCLFPPNWTSQFEADENPRRIEFHQRDILSVIEMNSDKVLQAGMLAMKKYMMTNNGSELELRQFLGGCKQQIAGELLYLIFSAEEKILCRNENCTGPVVMDQECRARIHIDRRNRFNPFYVSCHSPEFYALPWRGINA